MSTIPHPPVESWPLSDGGIPMVNVEGLLASWEARTGPDNIRAKWQTVGVANVLDRDWLTGYVNEFDDDAFISLWVDCCSFNGDADLQAQIDIMAPRMVALWEAGES